LRLSAKESYQKEEVEIEALTGVKVGHRRQQKLVVEQDWELPQGKQAVCEVRVDGGKVQIGGKHHKQAGTGETIKPFVYKEFMMAHFLITTSHSLVGYVNSQSLVNPLCVWGMVMMEFGI
jgi:hypothetical protein